MTTNIKISALSDGSPVLGTDQIPIARSGANYSITPSEITTYMLNPANSNVDITPTGTGIVTMYAPNGIIIAPGNNGLGGTGTLTVFPINTGNMDNMIIGQFTPTTGNFTYITSLYDLSVSGTITGSALTITGTGTFPSNTIGGGIQTDPIIISAGTATYPSISLTAGLLTNTAAAGAIEYDGTVGYFTPSASSRGVLMSEQIQTLTSAYTLTSQIAAQKLFNATTNGAITLPVGTYEFECSYSLSSMSSTSGSFGFALGGAATFTQYWEAHALKAATLSTAAAPAMTYNTAAANTTLIAANVNTTAYAKITGIIRVSVAGTVIPQVSLGVAAAAVVGVGSYFKIRQVGINTVTNVGNWS